jgi:ATP-dependent exoDNAse (exonuclease V) beta subunit
MDQTNTLNNNKKISKKNDVLEKYYANDKDNNIRFYEKEHKYEVLTDKKTKYTSVTTFVHYQFPKFDADVIIDSMMNSKGWGPLHKYWGQTKEEIKSGWISNSSKESKAGTNLHYKIECFMNNPNLPKGYTNKDLYDNYLKELEFNKELILDTNEIEWNYFINFLNDFPYLKPYRTEWKVYDEDIKISGCIDMVYENPDGSLSIYDWKRSKEINTTNTWNKFALTDCIAHLPDTNFWHYSLQLNIYKRILEDKYDKVIKDLYLVRFHNNNENNTYELLSVPFLNREIDDLYELRKQKFK